VGFRPWIKSWSEHESLLSKFKAPWPSRVKRWESPMEVPSFASFMDSHHGGGVYKWGHIPFCLLESEPGSSRTRGIMRTEEFACSLTRQTFAVCLSQEELSSVGKGVFLKKTHSPAPPGLSWYLLGGRRFSIAFARWVVSNYKRTIGLSPRPLAQIAKLPEAIFLLNYSKSRRLEYPSLRPGTQPPQVKPVVSLRQDESKTRPESPIILSDLEYEAIGWGETEYSPDRCTQS